MKVYHYKIIGGTQIKEIVFDSSFLFHHNKFKLKIDDGCHDITINSNRINVLIKVSASFAFFYSIKKVEKQDYDKLLKGIGK